MNILARVQRVFSYVAIVAAFFAFGFVASAQENIDPSNLGNQYAALSSDSSAINFECTNCNVEVTDTAMNGYAWGAALGWINLQPSGGGVANDGSGVLTGYAWGSNTGWVNFNPTNGGVSISTTTGYFSGSAWVQNYGWITFDCTAAPGQPCVETSWRPADNPPGGGSGCSASVKPSIEVISTIDPTSDELYVYLGQNLLDYITYVVSDDESPESYLLDNINLNPELEDIDVSIVSVIDDVDFKVFDEDGCNDSVSKIVNVIDPLNIEGCTDPAAFNYNSAATIDNDSCVILIYGCMDALASNYSSTANIDNSTCTYGGSDTEGCTDPTAFNYSAEADTDDGSCLPVVEGCIDPTANNYDSSANTSDSSCAYDPIEGCTDSTAFNYDSSATIDDNSCTPVVGGCTDSTADNYDSSANTDNGSCIIDIDNDPTTGCVDETAFNYSAEADTDDGSCTFEVIGCMDNGTDDVDDVAATNYNQFATIDTDPSLCLYNVEVDDEEEECTTDCGAEDDEDQCAVNCDTDDDGDCDLNCDTDDDNDCDLNCDTDDDGVCDENCDVPIDILEVIEDLLDDATDWIDEFIGENVAETFSVAAIGLASIIGVIANVVLQPTSATALFQVISRWFNAMFTGFAFRKRKKPWGTIYDSMTKQPLDPVYVSLKNAAAEEVQSAISDIDGRYGFLVGPDTYTIAANKGDYTFPSEKMKGSMSDIIYTNLYFGQPFEVKMQDEVVNHDIPLDPVNFNWNEFEKKRTGVMKFHSNAYLWYVRVARILFWVGFIATAIITPLYPSTFNYIVLGLYVLSLVLQLTGRGGFRSKGVVRFAEDRTPMSFGIIRVFSASLNREIRKTVTGPTGAYFILLPKGNYYYTIEKRVGENQYEEVYRSAPKKMTKGFLNKKLKI